MAKTGTTITKKNLTKKKVNKFTLAECLKEKSRLEAAGDFHSLYHDDIDEQIEILQGKVKA